MPNLFRHPISKVCDTAVSLSRGILKQVQDDILCHPIPNHVIASAAWQSPRSYIERDEIASSFLLAMTWLNWNLMLRSREINVAYLVGGMVKASGFIVQSKAETMVTTGRKPGSEGDPETSSG